MRGDDDNRFFKWVWRFNAIAIAGAAMIVAVAATFVVHEFYRNMMRERSFETRDALASQALPAAANSPDTVSIRLGRASPLEGTTLTVIEALREQSQKGSYHTKEDTGNVVNYFFTDSNNGKANWLLPDGKVLIADVTWIVKGSPSPAITSHAPVTAAVYVLVRADTNSDGIVGGGDRKTLAVSSADGTGLRTLFEADRIHSVVQASEDRVTVVYSDGEANYVAHYALPQFDRLSTQEIPKLGL